MRKLLSVAVVVLLCATSAFAKDELVTIDGKNIKVSDVTEKGWFNKKFHTNELKDGVYISTGSTISGDTLIDSFPNAKRIIEERFALRGIKVSNKLQSSSQLLSFWFVRGIDIANADRAAAHSSMPDGNQAIANANLTMGLGKSLGNGGLIGSVIGLAFSAFSDDKILLQVMAHEKPEIRKVGLFDKIGVASSTDNFSIKSTEVSYSLEKGKEAGDDTVLKVVVDKWIDTFIVFDAPAVEQAVAGSAPTAPASSVVVIAEITAAKPALPASAVASK